MSRGLGDVYKRQYDNIAREILEDSEISWEEKEDKVNRLLLQFVERIRR